MHKPLWIREIRLAGFQQKRHEKKAEAGTPMRGGEDEAISTRDLDQRDQESEVVHCVSPAFQWLPRGIRLESLFNRFISRETR